VKVTAGVEAVFLCTTWSGVQDQMSAVTKRRALSVCSRYLIALFTFMSMNIPWNFNGIEKYTPKLCPRFLGGFFIMFKPHSSWSYYFFFALI